MNPQTELYFCFDTEDFTSSYAADAIRDTARLLESEGIQGNYMMVGLLAQQLISWGRYDVLEALKAHNIEFHSYSHSIHPTLIEYTDLQDFDEAYRRLMAEEAQGVGMVRAVTGRNRLHAASPPGNSTCYVAMYAYRDLGMRVYCDTQVLSKEGKFVTPYETADGHDLYYCNLFHLLYRQALESHLFNEDFDPQALAEELAGYKRAVLFNHPNMILYSRFWDSNYDRSNHCAYGQWPEMPRRSPQEVERFYTRMRELVRLLKADGRFVFRTIRELTEEMESLPPRTLTREQLPAIRDALKKAFRPDQFAFADLFQACQAFLKGADSFTAGLVYGFLEEPQGVEHSVVLSAAGIRQAAEKINAATFLPERIEVDGISVGPADFLFAMLDLLCDGGEEITVTPRDQLGDTSEFPNLGAYTLKGSWVYADDFEDLYQTKRLRLQFWTLHR